MYTRYALFYTPPKGALEAFGRSWLGWCSRDACEVTGAGPKTERPSKYGVHATLVAPFALAGGTCAQDILDAARVFAANAAPVSAVDGLHLSQQHGFFALRPRGDAPDLMDFAASCVRSFHALRAAPDDAELARRRRARLSPSQEAHLMRWGYPYVMADFQFHITLTGRIKKDADEAAAQIETRMRGVPLVPFAVDGVTVMGERADGRFVQLERFALSASSATDSAPA